MKTRILLTSMLVALLLVGMLVPGAIADEPVTDKVGDAQIERDLAGADKLQLAGGGSGIAAQPSGAEDVLFDQPDNGYNSLIAQYFPDFLAGVYSADDFENAETWYIETIFVDGVEDATRAFLNEADSLNWCIWPDAGGVPAGEPDVPGNEYWCYTTTWDAPEVTLVNNNQSVILDHTVLGGPLEVPAGHWWFAFWPSINYTLYGQWFWDTADGAPLNPVVIDPVGLVGFPNVWTDWTIAGGDPNYTGMAFSMTGTAGGMDEPDIRLDPPALDATLCPDEQFTTSMYVCNDGTAPLVWSLSEVDGTLGKPDAVGDLLYAIDAGTPTGDTQLLGLEYVDGHYWVTGGNSGLDPNKLYKLDSSGALVATYDQSSNPGWGWRDLAYDGTYLYGSDSSVLAEIDPATGMATGNTIPCPENPCRALAYDPATDHFWTQNFGGPLYEFDRSGVIHNTFVNGLAAYGAAWDTWSPGGPFLWIWSQDGSGFDLVLATQIDPTTGNPTGVSFPGAVPYPGTDNFAGGATISPDVVPGYVTFIGMHQTQTDTIAGYELVVGEQDPIPWLSEDPTAGEVGPGECQEVSVHFDSTGLAPGMYYGELFVESNDPDTPELYVPVTMEVDECALNTMHVHDIVGMLGTEDRWIMRVLVADQDDMVLGDVWVDVTISTPMFEWARWRYTKPTGWARFWTPLRDAGNYQICVDNLTLNGYVYDPGDNIVTCADWDYMP